MNIKSSVILLLVLVSAVLLSAKGKKNQLE